MAQLIKLAWRSIWRSRRRTIITIVSISFSLTLAVFFIAFADGMYAKLIDDAVRMQAGHLTIENAKYREAPAIDLVVSHLSPLRKKIESLEGVERTKALVVGQGVAKSGLGAIGVAVIGVEPDEEKGSSPLANKIVSGRYLEKNDQGAVVVGARLIKRLKLESKRDLKRLTQRWLPIAQAVGVERDFLVKQFRKFLSVGKKLVIATNNIHGEMVEELVRVKGVFETGAVEVDGFIIQVPIGFARKLYGMKPGQATQLGILLKNPEKRGRLQKNIEELVNASNQTLASRLVHPQLATSALTSNGSDANRMVVRRWEEVLPDLAAYIKIDGGSNYVFQGILLFLVMFTIFNTILMSVLERRREFAVVLALGTPPARLKVQIMLETAMIGLIGVFFGLGIGGSLAYALQVYGLDLTKMYAEGVSVSGFAIDPIIHAKVMPEMLLTVGGLVFGATLLLSLYPMGRIKRIPVAQILR